MIPYSEIVNQNFQAGSGYVQSVANAVRKSYCGWVQNLNDMEDAAGIVGNPLRVTRDFVKQYVCELPQEPIPIFPDTPLLPPGNNACECDRMKVTYQRNVALVPPFSDTQTRFLRAPIVPHTESVVTPSGETRYFIGFKHRGTNTGECLAEPVFTSVMDLVPAGSSVQILELVPDPAYPAPAPCQRPVFPPRSPRFSPPRNPPEVTIPQPPGFPPINLPVIPRGFTFSPEFSFNPTINLDVGGINFEFSLGGVNINFNANVGVPVTVAPNVFLPILPPVVLPVPIGGGGCNLTPVLSAIQVLQATANSIVADVVDIETDVDAIIKLQVETIVPLLKDIQECACPPESEMTASFANLQTYTHFSSTKEILFVTLNIVDGTDFKKTFGVEGGVDVAISGWYSFGVDNRYGERKSLQYVNNILVAPYPNCNQFTFSLYNGLQASGTIHTRKEN